MYCDDYRINKIVNDGYLYDYETNNDGSVEWWFTSEEMAMLKDIKAGKRHVEIDDIPCEWNLTEAECDKECIPVLKHVKETCMFENDLKQCEECPFHTDKCECHFPGCPDTWVLE